MHKLTLLPEAIRVSHSLLPENKKESRTLATSGRRCLELLHRRDPLLSLLKTLLVTYPWASMRCSLTWKTKATPHGRLLFQLVPSMRPTVGTGSGLWPTPTANDDNKSPDAHMAMKERMKGGPRKTITSLQVMVKAMEQKKYPHLWATPQARDGDHGAQAKRYTDRERSADLPDQVAAVEQGLVIAPTANNTTERTGGSLNPNWVEWLMGYPIGHTDLER